MNKIKLILLLIISSAPFSSGAFESYPEYMGPSSVDILNLDDPQQIDAEYQSDYITFLKPLSWNFDLGRQASFVDSSVGSLSSKRFMVRSRMQIVKELNESLFFKATYFDESDLEDEQKHFLFEFQKWLNNKWGVAIEGEVSTRKSEDDIGLSVFFQPNNQKQWKLFQRYIDFSRNKRNEDNDIYRKAPTVSGLVFRSWSNKNNFSQHFIRHEPQLRWFFPTTNQEYQFEKYVVGSQLRWTTLDLSQWTFKGQFDHKEKRQISSNTFQKVQRGLLQLDREKDRWLLGYHFAYRNYSSRENDQTKLHHLPYFYYKLSQGKSYWKLGFDAAIFDDNGSLTEASETRTDYRLNISYKKEFSKQSQMIVNLGFDGDRFGSGETWEGGNIQFRAEL